MNSKELMLSSRKIHERHWPCISESTIKQGSFMRVWATQSCLWCRHPTLHKPNLSSTKRTGFRCPQAFRNHHSLVFREDSFDAVTRTRRGRLYVSQQGEMQPHAQNVAPHPYEDPFWRQAGASGRQ